MKAPNSLSALIDWLKTKPVDETYDFMDGYQCAIAQYLRSLGFKGNDTVLLSQFADIDSRFRAAPEFFGGQERAWMILSIFTGSGYSNTFGEALKRAEELQESGFI